MNKANIIKRFLELADVNTSCTSIITEAEHAIAVKLVDLLNQSVCDNTNPMLPAEIAQFHSHDRTHLPMSMDEIDEIIISSDDEYDSSGSEESDFDYDESPDYQHEFDKTYWTYAEMLKLADYVDQHPNHSYRTIMHNFRKLKHQCTISQILHKVRHTDMKRKKIAVINDAVYERYRAARTSRAALHGKDIRRWAFAEGLKLGADFFKASKHWLRSFQNIHRIASRKITKVRTRKEIQNESNQIDIVNEFRVRALKTFANYSDDQIFNTDQSGYQYEMHSTRTLSDVGEKNTEVGADSLSATTHSYSIMILVDRNGRLRGNVLICLREYPTGVLGPKLKPQLEGMIRDMNMRNVELTCSRSGNVEPGNFEWWIRKVLVNEISNRALLVLDHYGVHMNEDRFDVLPINKTCDRLLIPKKCTPMLQPLDVFYFWSLERNMPQIS